MEADTQKAKEYLQEHGLTCVLCRGEELVTSDRRGVQPLLELLDSGRDLRGFCAADKLVSRATAFLYCLLGVRAVWARTLSIPAIRVLVSHGISVAGEDVVLGIRNRTDTGPCPMEEATQTTEDPHQALHAIRQTLQDLQRQQAMKN